MTNKQAKELIAQLMDYNTSLSLDDRSDIADQIARTSTGLEEAQAQVRVLTDALSHAVKVIQDSDEWWMDCPDKGGFDLDRLEQALSSSPIATYQAARAVIDAVNFNSGTLTIIAQGNHFGSETVTHLLKLNTALQELEHNNAGGE